MDCQWVIGRFSVCYWWVVGRLSARLSCWPTTYSQFKRRRLPLTIVGVGTVKELTGLFKQKGTVPGVDDVRRTNILKFQQTKSQAGLMLLCLLLLLYYLLYPIM